MSEPYDHSEDNAAIAAAILQHKILPELTPEWAKNMKQCSKSLHGGGLTDIENLAIEIWSLREKIGITFLLRKRSKNEATQRSVIREVIRMIADHIIQIQEEDELFSLEAEVKLFGVLPGKRKTYRLLATG